MPHYTLVIKVVVLIVALAGCARYEAGSLDRERCETLRPGMTQEQVIAVMGPPRRTRDSGIDPNKLTLVYNQPAMSDLPIFGEDKDVEVVMSLGVSGYILKEPLCTGVD